MLIQFFLFPGCLEKGCVFSSFVDILINTLISDVYRRNNSIFMHLNKDN